MLPISILDTMNVKISETIDVTQTKEVNGASKSKRSELPYLPFMTISLPM